jgi:hypothetical protein
MTFGGLHKDMPKEKLEPFMLAIIGSPGVQDRTRLPSFALGFNKLRVLAFLSRQMSTFHVDE